jgi:hypothetical protein
MADRPRWQLRLWWAVLGASLVAASLVLAGILMTDDPRLRMLGWITVGIALAQALTAGWQVGPRGQKPSWLKARHPGQVGVPPWWPWLAWPMTLVGLACILLGAVQVVSGDLLGWQAVLPGPVFLVLAWANAIARRTLRPGMVAVSGAEARTVARRHRYMAGVVLIPAVGAVAVAVAIARDPGLAADPPPGGVGLAVAVTLLATVAYLLLALLFWLRAWLIDSWA